MNYIGITVGNGTHMIYLNGKKIMLLKILKVIWKIRKKSKEIKIGN